MMQGAVTKKKEEKWQTVTNEELRRRLRMPSFKE